MVLSVELDLVVKVPSDLVAAHFVVPLVLLVEQ